MTSLEGVRRTAVTAAELGTLMLVSVRGWPLLNLANGPAFRAGHIPSSCMMCERPWVLSAAEVWRWLLLLLSVGVLVTAPHREGDGPRPVRAGYGPGPCF
jgi:hypothetical protein